MESLDVVALESKARIILGWDEGTATPITAAERREMADWGNEELGYPPHEAPEGDEELSRWFLGALNAAVQDKWG